MAAASASGPLAGLRVVEFGAIGPGPFACMMLSDMGADVVTVERPDAKPANGALVVNRGRRRVVADLKQPADREAVLALLERADILVEGFRPGVMERLGLGPDEVARRNPRLIYGRMTGWGQEGPLARTAGHEINFIAIGGALHAIGTTSSGPVLPLNLVGDYGGGSMYLLAGLLAALHEARRSGRGQVVDAAITDGVISLMGNCMGRILQGVFREERGVNLLNGAHPYYSVYETADGEHVVVGAGEPQFFAELCRLLDLPEDLRDAQHDTARWPALRAAIAGIIRQRTQSEWTALMAGTDACYAPVLSISAAQQHPHNIARQAFVAVGGAIHPAPAPRFSRTPSAVQGPPAVETLPIGEVVRGWAGGAQV